MRSTVCCYVLSVSVSVPLFGLVCFFVLVNVCVWVLALRDVGFVHERFVLLWTEHPNSIFYLPLFD